MFARAPGGADDGPSRPSLALGLADEGSAPHLAASASLQASPQAAVLSGKVVTHIGSDAFECFGSDIALQADGKIVMVGVRVDAAGDGAFAVLRYGASGKLDGGFGAGGIVSTGFGGGYDHANAVVVQADGKLMVAGGRQSDDGAESVALARYLKGGQLDAAFSSDGKTTRDFSGSSPSGDQATDVAVLSSGKILVSGIFNLDFGLARFNASGSIDTNFSGDGMATVDFGARHAVCHAMAVQADGKIVLVGEVIPDGPLDGSRNFAIARFNANGTLDTTFSGDGKLTIGFGGADSASSVVLQADGKILVAGSSDDHWALARIKSNGSLDTSFSSDGKVETSFGSQGSVSGIALQSNGSIVVAGQTTGAGGSDFALARYKPGGGLDTGFGTGGRVSTDFGADDYGSAVALQADGRILVGGSSGDSLALARYLTDGRLDTAFGDAPAAAAADLLFG